MVLEIGTSEAKSVAPGKASLLSCHIAEGQDRAKQTLLQCHSFFVSGGETVTVYWVPCWDAGHVALTLLHLQRALHSDLWLAGETRQTHLFPKYVGNPGRE